MPADTGTDAGFYRPLLDSNGKCGTAARAFLPLDTRPVGDGSLLYSASYYGRQYVVPAKVEPSSTGSHASKGDAMDASYLHLFLPVFPSWTGAVLDR